MKILSVVLAVLLLTAPVFAGQTQTEIIDTKLTKAAPASSGDKFVGDANKVSFFVTYQSSSATGTVTADITMAASLDGVSWGQCYWMDGQNNVTNTYTLKDSSVYGMWLPQDVTIPQMRISVNATNYSTYDYQRTADISVTVVEKK